MFECKDLVKSAQNVVKKKALLAEGVQVRHRAIESLDLATILEYSDLYAQHKTAMAALNRRVAHDRYMLDAAIADLDSCVERALAPSSGEQATEATHGA